MEHPNEFQKILRQVMSREPKPVLSEEEIHFDVTIKPKQHEKNNCSPPDWSNIRFM